MGVYLGSVDLLGGGGGGGGSIGKTITVGEYNYVNAQPLTVWQKLGFSFNKSNVGGAVYVTRLNTTGDTSYTATLPGATNDTYVTIANVTTAPNGGALTMCGGSHYASQGQSSASTQTIKITIDGGTPVELTQQTVPSSQNQTIFILGGGWLTNISGKATDDVTSVQRLGYGLMPRASNATTSEYLGTPGANGVTAATQIPYYSAGGYIGYYHSIIISYFRADAHLLSGLPFVHFTTSCKVEIKKATSTNYDNYGFAEIKTF